MSFNEDDPRFSMEEMMAADAKKEEGKPDTLKELFRMVHELKAAEEAVAEAELELKRRTERMRNLSEIQIPDLFDSMGASELKLDSGEKVSVKRSYAASITAEKQEAAFDWLCRNGHEGLIKHNVEVAVKKGDEMEYSQLVKEIKHLGLTYTDKSSVHPSTLKSFVKEQIEAGSDLPLETFSVFPVRKTKIS